MTPGFIKYWKHAVTEKDSPEYEFAQKMVGLPKVVFSKTLKRIDGKECSSGERVAGRGAWRN